MISVSVRFLALLSVFVVGCRGNAPPDAAMALSGDSMKLDRVVDLGEQIPGEKVSRTIEIANESANIVEIAEIRTSCGCTAASTSSDTILPGGKVDLNIEMRIPRDGGEFSHSVTIVCKNPVLLERSILINGIARHLIEVSHQELVLNELGGGRGVAGELRVYSPMGKPLNNIVVEGSDSLEFKVISRLSSELVYEVSLSDNVENENKLWLNVKTGVVSRPTIEIPVKIARNLSAVIYPQVLNVGVVDAGKHLMVQFDMTPSFFDSHHPLKSLKCTSEGQEIDIVVSESSISFNLLSPVEGGFFGRDVVFYTDSGFKQTVRVCGIARP